ncbi:MAG: hypothetical protein GU344_00240 [Thermocrinis sp.]|jgi:hypothetical protein|nr:hypothetical protein [Thermocrinis sp.]
MKKLVYLGFVIAGVAIALKIFVDKVDEETEKAYQQAQDQLVKENLEKLRMLSPPPSGAQVKSDKDNIDKLRTPPSPPSNRTSQGNPLY